LYELRKKAFGRKKPIGLSRKEEARALANLIKGQRIAMARERKRRKAVQARKAKKNAATVKAAKKIKGKKGGR
jgi:hypothetical protein